MLRDAPVLRGASTFPMQLQPPAPFGVNFSSHTPRQGRRDAEAACAAAQPRVKPLWAFRIEAQTHSLEPVQGSDKRQGQTPAPELSRGRDGVQAIRD